MKFIDFFAGVGGFRAGMERGGHQCVGFCEFDKFATASYTAMHLMTDAEREQVAALPKNKRVQEANKEKYRHGEWYANDIRTVQANDIPEADCWCFGFPCQDISIAGKQVGFDGERSSLFFSVTKLIRELKEENRPTYLFIENVKNLLGINRGIDFAKLLIELDEIGQDAEWSVLNSKNFGVPQNRERVFIIGHLRGRGGREVFPVQGTDAENCISVNQIGRCPGTNRDNPNQYRVYDTEGISPTLSKMDGGGREPHIIEPICMNPKGGRNGIPGLQPSIKDRVYAVHGIMPTVATSEFFNPNVAIPVLTPDRASKRQNGRRFKDNGEPMFTLTGQDRHGVAISIDDTYGFDGVRVYEDSFPCLRSGRQGQKVGIGVQEKEEPDNAIWYEKYQCYIAIRKLTPKECFRLQGFPDWLFDRAEMVSSNSQLYKQAGNSVTIPVIETMAKKMSI